MWRLFFAFLAAAALLYGGLHMLGRRDRMAAQRASTPSMTTPSGAPASAAALPSPAPTPTPTTAVAVPATSAPAPAPTATASTTAAVEN